MITKHFLSTTTAVCLTLAAVIGLEQSASASVITLNTRASGSGPLASAADYKTYIDGLTSVAPDAGHCDTTLAVYDSINNAGTCGTGVSTSTAFHFGVAFNVSASQAGAWDFRIGPDFGFGGAMFLDGVAIDYNPADMWWAGSYANPSQVFIESGITLAAGAHTIDVYGIEGCCDGGQQGQYLAPGSRVFTSFAAKDGLSVPEPASLALLGLGLAGLGYVRRKRA